MTLTVLHRRPRPPDDTRDRVVSALADPRELAHRLGLLHGSRRQTGGGVFVRCVWHEEHTPSLSLFVRGGHICARCHGCGHTGSALDVIAAAHHLALPGDYRAVLRLAVELVGGELPVPVPHAPEPPREPPPVEEVRALLEAAVDPERDRLVRGWVLGRGLDPAAVAPLARAIRSGAPWAASGEPPRRWADGPYRLLVPVYDAAGELRSVRARKVKGSSGPKELPPTGARAAGYVFANRAALVMLRTGVRPPAVLIVEGTPDFLTWATRAPRWPVIGLPGSGAWSRDLADRIPAGVEVVVRTDPDDAGDRYAAMVAQHLTGRCRVLVSDATGRARRRALCVGGRGSGLRGEDENDRLRSGTLPEDPRDGCAAL